MPKIAIFNMAIGFLIIFFMAAAGTFLAYDITQGFLKDHVILESWQHMMSRSAHGHGNLFGIIHIAFGLTLPYSVFSLRFKRLQTFGLLLGSFAMGFLLHLKGMSGPTEAIDILNVVIGVCLSLWLISIASHCYALFSKLNA
jgi:hypothetical protein